jgi:copper chaperone CopZ
MNPQGTCCLGNVNRAVQQIRASLAGAPPVDARPQNENGLTMAAGAACLVSSRPVPPNAKGAFLPALGAVFTAVLGSACCWLPLLLIAFGFSAVGIGSFFGRYRPHLLWATFTLLGIAWYMTYRASLVRAWARLTGQPKAASGTEISRSSESPPRTTDSCCAIESETDDCCATKRPNVSGLSVGKWLTVLQFHRVVLWMATVMILLLAFFPHWIGVVVSGGPSSPVVSPNGRQVVLELHGMTCEACAVTIEQALRQVTGVAHVQVNYYQGEAVITLKPASVVRPEVLIQTVRDTGCDAQVKE